MSFDEMDDDDKGIKNKPTTLAKKKQRQAQCNNIKWTEKSWRKKNSGREVDSAPDSPDSLLTL